MSGFSVGNRVSIPGGEGEIVQIEERAGDTADLLYVQTATGVRPFPSTAGVEKVTSPIDHLMHGSFGDPARYALRKRTALLDLTHRTDRFVALPNSRVEIEPYQVEAARQVLTSFDRRYLIADEVGLGKTTEAGIVLKELSIREHAERVLIVTPAPLQEQWQTEMREKFGRDYDIYDRERIRELQAGSAADNVWELNDRVITSIDFAKQDDNVDALANLKPEWDLAIFDEAHHLTARRRSSGRIERTKRYNLAEVIAACTDGLLFLTATCNR